MRYKNYVWPHNPRVYSISYKRKVGAREVPFGHYALQDLGPSYRIMRGEGEFVGEGAYDEFKNWPASFTTRGRVSWSIRCGRRPTPTLWNSPSARSPERTM